MIGADIKKLKYESSFWWKKYIYIPVGKRESYTLSTTLE